MEITARFSAPPGRIPPLYALLGHVRPHTRRLLLSALLSLSVHAIALQWFNLAPWQPPALPDPLTLQVSIDVRQHTSAAAEILPRLPPQAQRAIRRPKPLSVPSARGAIAAAPVQAADVATTPALPAPVAAATETAASSTPPLFHADYLHNPPPAYPMAARRHGMQGRVTLRAEIQPDGSCSQTVIQQSSGWQLLDQAAMQTVRTWRFVPAKRGSQAIAAWVEVPVSFRLEP